MTGVPAGETPARVSIVPVRAGSAWLGIDASRVVEVLPHRPWAPIVGISPLVLGIIPWRGRAIAVVDTSAWANAASQGGSFNRLLVVAWADFVVALGADAVHEVQQVEVKGEHLDFAGARLSVVELDRLGRDLLRAW